MKVKIRQLSEAALDWAVAKALGLTIDSLIGGAVWAWTKDALTGEGETVEVFRPSRDWSQGGPIMQELQINLQYCTDLRDSNRKYMWASMDTNSAHGYSDGHGQPLVAAMRCLVAYHAHGQEEIEIPEEILS